MYTSPVPLLRNFIQEEKLRFSLSEESPLEFWVDESGGSVTVKFKIDTLHHEIYYDVYATDDNVHLQEKTLRDAERLEFLAEEQRRWKKAESIEQIWLLLDCLRLWAKQNNFSVTEKILI
jgi:hypothetical protein